MRRAIFPSTMPAPAAIVSATCFSTESPGASAAPMPPGAQAEEAPSPIGAAASTVTGRGARRSAANSPASPPPRMITSSVSAGTMERRVVTIAAFRRRSALQVDHALDGAPGLLGNQRVDGHLVLEIDEAVEDPRQRDPLHVRAKIARPN